MSTSRSPLDSLADPAPPTPDAATRAAVQERAHQILRRRRLTLGAGTLACTAVLAVGVVALAGSSSDSGPTANKIEAASTPDAGTTVTTPALTTTPAPAATEPAPAASEEPVVAETPAPSTPAPASEAELPAPVPTSLTVTVGGAPTGATIEVTITGPNGDIMGTTTTGSITFTDLAPGIYEVFWSWQTDDGASAVGRSRNPVDIGEGPHSIAL